MKRWMCSFIVTMLILSLNSSAGVMKYAGCRQSSYGANPYPTEYEWSNVFLNMASFFPGSTPTGIWIVGNAMDQSCSLQFPSPGGSYTNITFLSYDKHEEFLSYFDDKGIKVFLQVESAYADVNTLIDLVLNQYKSHSSVIGFGVDVEWYNSTTGQGSPISDANAQAWENKVKSHNSSYRLFLKHWETSYMPPSHRGSIIFVNDAQQMGDLNSLRGTFQQWAQAFPSNTVFYQGGYNDDRGWWANLTNPPKDIGNELVDAIGSSQEMGMFWVDFTMHDPKVEELLFNPDINPTKLTVTITIMNNGTVSLNPPGGEYDYGTSVTATANPGAGSKFEGWSGDVTGSNTTVTFTVNKNMKITALFNDSGTVETDVLDDFEDNDDVNILEGAWYTYDDQIPEPDGKVGNSTITPSPDDTFFVMTAGGANSSSYALKVNYSLDHGTLDYDGYVGFGCELGPVEGQVKDLSEGTGVTFYHKGGACVMKVEISDVADYAYHFASIEAHTDWTLVTKNWADFKQPTDWGTPVTFNPAHAKAFAWEVTGTDGTSGDLWIDDVRVPGMKFVPPTHIIPVADRRNTPVAGGLLPRIIKNELYLSYDITEPSSVMISIYDMRGKTMRECVAVENQAGSHSLTVPIVSLPNGIYTVQLTTGNKMHTRTFVLSR